MNHNLSLVEPEYRPIVHILLSWEDSLSDRFEDYCKGAVPNEMGRYQGDYVLATLAEIAKEILSTQKAHTIETMLAQSLWPEINLETLKVYQIPRESRWAILSHKDRYGDDQVEQIPLVPIKILLYMNYDPKSNTLAMQETVISKGE